MRLSFVIKQSQSMPHFALPLQVCAVRVREGWSVSKSAMLRLRYNIHSEHRRARRPSFKMTKDRMRCGLCTVATAHPKDVLQEEKFGQDGKVKIIG
jgi:hypothetical protein